MLIVRGAPAFPAVEGHHGSPGTRLADDLAGAAQDRREPAQGPRSRRPDPPVDAGAAGCALFPDANRADPGFEPAQRAKPDHPAAAAADRRAAGGPAGGDELFGRPVRLAPARTPAGTRDRQRPRRGPMVALAASRGGTSGAALGPALCAAAAGLSAGLRPTAGRRRRLYGRRHGRWHGRAAAASCARRQRPRPASPAVRCSFKGSNRCSGAAPAPASSAAKA